MDEQALIDKHRHRIKILLFMSESTPAGLAVARLYVSHAESTPVPGWKKAHCGYRFGRSRTSAHCSAALIVDQATISSRLRLQPTHIFRSSRTHWRIHGDIGYPGRVLSFVVLLTDRAEENRYLSFVSATYVPVSRHFPKPGALRERRKQP